MRDQIQSFISYLQIEKNASPLTLKDYNLELQKFIDYLQSNQIESYSIITTSIIRKYLFYIKEKRNLSSYTFRKKIAVLKSFFNFLMEENEVNINPSRPIKMPKKEIRSPKLLSKYEINLVIESVKFAPLRCRKNYTRDKLIISMLYYTGIRRTELLSLNWNNINLENTTIIIKSGKGSKDRVIPIHPKLKELLEEYLSQRLPLKNNSLFIGECGKKLTNCSFSNLIKMHMTISGLSKKNYTAHSFRHSFATHLIESGADIFTVQKLLGHSSLDATRIYINFSANHLNKAVLSL